jgi:hypothetical protein
MQVRTAGGYGNPLQPSDCRVSLYPGLLDQEELLQMKKHLDVKWYLLGKNSKQEHPSKSLMPPPATAAADRIRGSQQRQNGKKSQVFPGPSSKKSTTSVHSIGGSARSLVVRRLGPARQNTEPHQINTTHHLLALSSESAASDIQDFLELHKQYAVAFYPLLQFQENVREMTLGETYWTRVTNEKKKLNRILGYMQQHEGKLPELSWKEKIVGLYDSTFALRKRGVEIYNAFPKSSK